MTDELTRDEIDLWLRELDADGVCPGEAAYGHQGCEGCRRARARAAFIRAAGPNRDESERRLRAAIACQEVDTLNAREILDAIFEPNQFIRAAMAFGSENEPETR